MLRAVVPLVRGEGLAGLGRSVIDEFVGLARGHAHDGCVGAAAWCFPGLAAIGRTLQDLAEPAGSLRRVDAIGIRGRTLHVKDLPTGKERTGDGPLFARAVGGQDESTFFGADEYSNLAHGLLLVVSSRRARPKIRS